MLTASSGRCFEHVSAEVGFATPQLSHLSARSCSLRLESGTSCCQLLPAMGQVGKVEVPEKSEVGVYVGTIAVL